METKHTEKELVKILRGTTEEQAEMTVDNDMNKKPNFIAQRRIEKSIFSRIESDKEGGKAALKRHPRCMQRVITAVAALAIAVGSGSVGWYFGSRTRTEMPQSPPNVALPSFDNAIKWEFPDNWDGSPLQLQLPEFPEVTFEWVRSDTINDEYYVRVITQSGESRHMFSTQASIFIDDLNGDGLPDFIYIVLCTAGCFTDEMRVYDFANDAHYAVINGDLLPVAL
jgi:hypothetical protein